MTDRRDTLYRHKDKVITRKVVDETLLVPVRGDVDQMHHLFAMNAVAAHVWNEMDGATALSDLIESVCATFEVDSLQAEKDVPAFVDQLLKAELVERL